MGALTAEIPKPMIALNGRPILEHILDSLPLEIDEIIFVVGYLGSVIQRHFGGLYHGKRLLYLEQDVLNGTAGALWTAKDILHDRFLVMNGDDICMREDLQELVSASDWAMLAQEVEEVGSMSKIILKETGTVQDILEKEAHTGGSGLANTANCFVLDTRIFSYPLVHRQNSTTEFGLPQTVVQAAADIPIHVIEAHALIRVTEPADLQKAEEMLRELGI